MIVDNGQSSVRTTITFITILNALTMPHQRSVLVWFILLNVLEYLLSTIVILLKGILYDTYSSMSYVWC